MVHRHHFLTRVHDLLRPARYLEIGMRNGDSLALASCPAVGIDPYYSITAELANSVHLFRTTSDEYFSRPDPLAPTGGRPFDLAFIDGPKPGYPEHLELIVELLRPGGLVIVDNVLMSGSVATQEPVGPWTEERIRDMRSFNERLMEHPRLTAAITPVGDGVALAARR